MFFVFLCCLAVLCKGVLGEDVLRINNASDMIQFSKNVSSGATYSGTTVFLDADIDFSGGLSGEFEPIGYHKSSTSNKYFQGTFDGQGHTISNLAINSSSENVGLFGCLKGEISNIVLDSSCYATNSHSEIKSVASGVIGQCRDCTIKNTVNMASAVFTGNASGSLFLGGIVGYLSASSKEAIVRNCQLWLCHTLWDS